MLRWTFKPVVKYIVYYLVLPEVMANFYIHSVLNNLDTSLLVTVSCSTSRLVDWVY